MASLEERSTSAGTTYRVKWRQDGLTQSETFGPDRRRAAERFKLDVEDNDHRWPDGWIKGHGYAASPAVDEQPQPADIGFLEYAVSYVRDRTGIQPDTRTRYARQVAQLACELDEVVGADPRAQVPHATIAGLTHRHIARWINAREQAGASPKTLANWHGLLAAILDTAVQEGLRPTNPCAITGRSLPRRDAHRTTEVHTHLTEIEFALIAQAMWPGLPDPAQDGRIVTVGSRQDRRYLLTAAGTAARWGELSAAYVSDCVLDGPEPYLDIQRAWKANGSGEYARPDAGRRYLGPPKTRKGRRRVPLSPTLVEVLREQIADRDGEELLFTATRGGPLDQPHWYEYRWQRAVALAQRNGLTKSPRFHDIRSTAVAWMATANVPLPEIQRRLGHESIQTTIDIYGGLMRQATEVANRAIDAALGWLSDPDGGAQPA